MMYNVNVDPITPKLGLQILDCLSKLGTYGSDEYPCTTSMIDNIAGNIQDGLSRLSNFERVDMGIPLMAIPIPPALELAKQCLEQGCKRDV